MRAMGDYFADLIFVERSDVGLGQFLEQEFVSQASGGFAGAFFSRPRMEKFTLACFRNYTNARVTRCARRSYEPAQPTQ